MSSYTEIKVPDIGGHTQVDVIEVLIKVGDTIAKEDGLITLETDKATMEVPASAAGVVQEIRVKVGDKVSEGDVIVLVDAAATAESTPVTTTTAPAASTTAAPTAAATEVLCVPDIGGHQDVDVIEVNVKEGDEIHENDGLITLETDKATMEVPATKAGRVVKVHIAVGDKVSEGSQMVTISTTAAATVAPQSAAVSAAAAPTPTPTPAAAAPTPSHESSSNAAAYGKTPEEEPFYRRAHAGPAVRKLARELGVDLHSVKGSGRKGRIVADDVKNFVKTRLNDKAPAASLGGVLDLLPWPRVDFARFGSIEKVPLSRIQKISGQNLSRNWVMIPHVTQHDEADMTDLEAFRRTMNEELAKEGIRLSPLVFILLAAVKTLQAFPRFNAALEDDQLVLRHDIHLGFAADTPNGLVVPVIHNADQKGIKDIARDLAELSALAREGKLKPQQMQGASFTVSSLGGIGGTAFTPIINAPEVAILGVSKSTMKPVWDGKNFVPRLMCPLSLSYDHRVIDGAAACRFTTFMVKVLGDFRRMMV